MKYLILLTSLLFGCTVYQGHLENAEIVCKEHKGIYKLEIDSPFIVVYCRDGTVFRNIDKN